jgi:succinate dehydrogenase/fumarate reductase flavoprotein subunit
MSEKKSKTGLTRRGFMKGAAAGAGAAALTGFGVRGAEAISPTKVPRWDYEADVVVVGYGGAGAVTAIAAHDLGAKVLILEKHKADTPTMINHTPSSRMCAGFFLGATDAQKAADYLYWTSWGATPRDCCEAMGRYMVTNAEYMRSLGGEVKAITAAPFKGVQRGAGEFSDVAPGGDAITVFGHKDMGAGEFKVLMSNIDKRSIPVLYEHRGRELIQSSETREILGVMAESRGRDVYVKAKKAVVLSTGGFEWDEEMKLNYLRGYPSYFYSNPENEGDGIKMAQKAGAALWHMSAMSARVIPYIKGMKPALGHRYPTPFILVNKYGRRFATEPGDPDRTKYRSHAFYLECIKFDLERVEYPQIPSYQIFDETTRLKSPFAYPMRRGLLPDGTAQKFYDWSEDNSAEIEKGWVIKASTIEKLAANIAKQDPENEGRMDSATLKDTIVTFNKYCAAGEDPDFHRSPEVLIPLERPPFYALKVYPGGPNTQGGAKKNAKGQVLDPEGKVIPRLYAPGENGSYFGFLYSGGGNIAENLAGGRITGENASRETPWE